MAPLKAVFEDSSNREALYVVLQDANYHYWIGSVDLESKVIKPLFDMYPFKFLEAGLANGKIYGWDLNSFFAADLATTTTTPTGERGPPYFCWGSADIASTKNLLRCFSNYYFTGLYNVSLPTGKINELLSIGPAFSQRLILLAYAPDGKLYATGDHPLVAHGPEYLLEVNTTNGAIRVIALLEDGVGSDFEAMTFVNNQLIGLGDATDTITRYGTEYEVKTQGFFNIDHKTGATSLIAHVEDFSGIQGFSIVDVVN